MDDTCQIGTLSTTASATGADTETYTYGAETACGLEMLSGQSSARSEFRTADGTVAFADAKLRIAHDAAVTITSRIKVTKLHGEAITAMIYDVLGEPAIGASGMVCYLRRVTT